MRKSRSFRRELIYSFLTITLISILCLGAFQIYQLSSLIDENQKSQVQTTKFLETYIINYIDEYKHAIEAQARSIEPFFNKKNDNTIKNQLKVIKEQYPGFVNVYVGDKNGKSVVFYPEIIEQGKQAEFNFSDRPYYKQLLKEKRTVISSVFPGRGGTERLLVIIASPILNSNNELEGYVLGALDLSALEDHIKNRNFGKASYAVVLDKENNVIVHPNIDNASKLINLSTNPIVKYIKKQPGGNGGAYFTSGEDGKKEYITYEKIEAFDGWTVWIGKPATVITNTYKHAIFTIFFFIIFTVIFLIAISMFLTNRIEKTILYLLQYIKDYTKGIKNKRLLEKAIHGPKEMEELSLHFNNMVDEIEKRKSELLKLNSELEERVQARTIDLKNKHAEIEAVLESMSEGLLLLNNDKQVEYINESFIKVIGDKDIETFTLTGLDDVLERFLLLFDINPERLLEFFNDDLIQLKLEYKKESGKTHYYNLFRFSVMMDDTKIGEGLLLRDITKEEEIDKLKNNLISLTSHEFKTPITNIKGSVETILRKDVTWDPEFQQELLEGVHEDIERIEQLINDWLDISKIESGTMYVERNMIRADYVIEESIAQIPKKLRENATIHFRNYLEEYPSFYADKSRVQEVLINLITNALRYNDNDSKQIEVILDKVTDYLTIAVSDNGIGISMDHITKIFNIFYQVDGTATRRTGGTGLGLSICKGIMEAHDGKIVVESELGKGSTFTLYFPTRRDVSDDESKDLYL
ncbi:sensor histidine kinase [Bacillus rubiinfantis]|uniref:sensor histidine kinase n=1 Tax=Bacillus rubiinfantis TaxID=1499680 RepID=UPI0005A6256A|nr:ATP-binding protein [Bacillus rubiinfantis]